MHESDELGYIYYRIGDDGEWEQFRVSELPPYRAARLAVEMTANALEVTQNMTEADREVELERVLARIEQL